MLFLAAAVQISLRSVIKLIDTHTTVKLLARLKAGLFESILRKEWIRIGEYHSGDLMDRFQNDIETAADGIMSIVPDILSLFAQLISAFYVLFTLDALYSFLTLLIGPVILIAGRLYGKKIKQHHIRCRESESSVHTFLQESLQNLLLIKTFSSEKRSVEKLSELLERNSDRQIRRSRFGVCSGFGLSLGFWLGYIFSVIWGAYRLSTGFITVGTLTAFIQLANRIQSPFAGLTRILPTIFASLASAGRLIEVETIAEEPPRIIPVPADMEQAMQKTRFVETLILYNVSFSYQEEKILNQVGFKLTKGDFVSLEGASGEGKTTLFRILLGLIRPEEGTLLIADSDSNEIPVDLHSRSLFSYVPQGNTVLSGTIEENLLYGCPNASEDDIWRCIDAACLREFVEELPDRLKTHLGERGLGISEGQAQRIAIARALLRQTPIFLFDEATSALDESTEAKIIENLKKWMKDQICIFVSHRKTISRFCDKVLILKNGELSMRMDCDHSHLPIAAGNDPAYRSYRR
jgi:ABC-type multidrug transport system fused ATPase/permease subunit